MSLEGELKKTEDGFEGYIACETMDVDLIIKRNKSEERWEASPDFIVYTKSPRKRNIEIGGLWHRISKYDDDYLSLSIKINGRVYNANSTPKNGEKGVLTLREWCL